MIPIKQTIWPVLALSLVACLISGHAISQFKPEFNIDNLGFGSQAGQTLVVYQQPQTTKLSQKPRISFSKDNSDVDRKAIEDAIKKMKQAELGRGKARTTQTLPDSRASLTSKPKIDPFANVELSPEDVITLSSLPPMCTSDLPGLDLSNVKSAQSRLAEEQGEFQRRVALASAEFQWPDHVPKTLENQNAIAVKNAVAQASFESPSINRLASSAPANSTNFSMPNPHASASAMANLNTTNPDGTDPHLEIYSKDAFPSAKECATCHEQIYEEWSSSSHAYASVSPMFHSFENTINRLAQGTLGYFCLRCHAPVATTIGLRRDQAIWDGPRVFREGVTCVACHRVKTPYTKANGERRIEPGDIYQPVYGSGDGNGVAVANKYSQFFKTKTNPADKSVGQPIHKRAIQFEELSESSFCMSCHQVDVKPGIKLEVVWDQYRASPACKQGISCQDCHMGKVPGVDAGYSIGPAAVVNEKAINAERRHSNHMFYGPGYSIAHPGIFPDNLKADRWKFNDWLEFDWRAGWGTDKFEVAIAKNNRPYVFPEAWREVDDRYDAREIVDANLKKLEYKRDVRRQVLENGSKLDGPFFNDTPTLGESLKFRYCLTNLNSGHNMPSGSLGAQPQIWMNAVLIGPDGQRIWESGYLDSNGDLADNHSLDVLARKIPFDTQLMNLQTKFLTTNVKGTDREMYLPVNFDFDQLPFLRPAPQPVTVINHPPGIRMEGHSIPALGKRNVKYSVPARLLTQPGSYRLSVRMRSRAEPIYFMRFCDATPEMERMMNEWIADFHTSTVTFEVR